MVLNIHVFIFNAKYTKKKIVNSSQGDVKINI